jgi:enoyl-CoA hydratase
VIEAKRTLADMARVATHDEAVDRELEPQVWSLSQPWFEERLAAIRARVSSKGDRPPSG